MPRCCTLSSTVPLECRAPQPTPSLIPAGPPLVNTTDTESPSQANKRNPAAARRAFSLFEMLVVMAIIALLIAISPAMLAGLAGNSGVSGGVQTSAAAVTLARSEASLAGGAARLAIDVDPDSKHYLQRLVVLKEFIREDGESGWRPASSMMFLPKGVFLYLPYVGGDQKMTYQFSNLEAPTQWIYFEYDTNGRLQLPVGSDRPQLVLISGVLSEGNRRSLSVTETGKKGMSGFVLRKSGSVSFFPSAPTLPTHGTP